MTKMGMGTTGSEQQSARDHSNPAAGGLLHGTLDDLVVHVILRNCKLSGRLALDHIRP